MKFFLHYFPVVRISLSFPALSPFWKKRMLKSARRLLHQQFCCYGHWFSGGQNRTSRVRESEGCTGDIPPAVFRNLLECPRRSAALGFLFSPGIICFQVPVRSECFLWWELEHGSRHYYKWGPGVEGEKIGGSVTRIPRSWHVKPCDRPLPVSYVTEFYHYLWPVYI